MDQTVDAPAPVDSGKPGRADVLADMPWEAPAPKEAKGAAAEKSEGETVATEPKEKSAAAPEATSDDGELAAALDEKSKASDDKPADKRLDTIAKAEKRSRELIAKERSEAKAAFQAEVETVKAELLPKLDLAKKYEAAKNQARTNPVELMRSLGLSEDDFEYAAQQLYNHSKAAASDPKRAQAAIAARREREKDERYEQLQKRLDAMENEKRQAAQASQFEQQKTQYVDHVVANIPADAPLLKKLVEKSPAKAKAELWKTAERLFAETQEMPDAEDLAAAYEKQRRAELADLDIDVATILGSKSAPAAAEAKRPAKTLDATQSQTTQPKPTAEKETAAERRKKLLDAMPWETGTA